MKRTLNWAKQTLWGPGLEIKTTSCTKIYISNNHQSSREYVLLDHPVLLCFDTNLTWSVFLCQSKASYRLRAAKKAWMLSMKLQRSIDSP